jgi:5'-deoxynucleotidase YfbR-like HD superfamily hydrolase
MRIFIEIFGAPAPEVTEFMLHHDTTELILGDPPFPLKRDNPVLKTIYTGLEPEAEMRIRGRVSPRLPEADRWRVKFCDVAEMWEFGMTEVDMGNRYAEMIEERTREELSRLLTVAPEGLWTIPAIEWVNSKESEYRS